MTAAELIRGRLLLWGATFAGAAALGLPDYRPPSRSSLLVLAGPGVGGALFTALAGGSVPRPRIPRSRAPAVAARWAYLAAAAAFEELLWRGLALAGLALVVGPLPALAVSSAGFAVWHRRSFGRRCAVHLITGFAFGAAFLTGGLVAAILAHAVYNVLVDLAVQSQRACLRGP